MSPRRVLALALRIIRQFLRDRRSLALIFLAPLVIMTLLNFVLNSSSSAVTLGIVPPDGQAGALLLDQIHSDLAVVSGVTVLSVSRDAVDTTLRNGDADAVLVFPAALGPDATLALHLEGSNPSAAQQIRGLVTQLVNGLAQASPSRGPAAPGFAPQLSVSYLYGGPDYTETDALAPLFIGLFAYFFIFLLTSVSFLRERSQGTIERLMVSPLSRGELVLGYVIGFTAFALLQSIIILAYVIYVLRVHYAGNLGLLFLVTLALTIGAVNLGIFVSAFARNELQVIQFIPLLLVPQVLLGGLFFSVSTLPVVLHQLAYVMPLTYSNFALKDVMLRGFGFGDIWPDLAFLVGTALLMILLAAFSLRQERV
jgi:ABC-2 type transport system permease protein